MTSKVRIIHAGGNKRVGVFNVENNEQVATLEKEGDEIEVLVHDSSTFTVGEVGGFVNELRRPVGPTPNAPNPDGDPVTEEALQRRADDTSGREL